MTPLQPLSVGAFLFTHLRQCWTGLDKFLVRTNRPLGLALIAIAHWVLALWMLVALLTTLHYQWTHPLRALSLQEGVDPPVYSINPYLGETLFWGMILIGAAVALGWGLWRFHRLTYWLVLSLNGCIIVGCLVIGLPRSLISILVTSSALLITVYLLRPRIRAVYRYNADQRLLNR